MRIHSSFHLINPKVRITLAALKFGPIYVQRVVCDMSDTGLYCHWYCTDGKHKIILHGS